MAQNYNFTTITEKRAPTDESIRLLNEMQSKSLDNLISRISITNNIVNAEVLLFRIDGGDFMQVFCFKINGQEYKIKKIMNPSFDIYGKIILESQYDSISKFAKIVSEELVSLLFNKIINSDKKPVTFLNK